MKPLIDLDFRTTFVDGGVLYTPSRGTMSTRARMGTGVSWLPSITPVGARYATAYVDTLLTNLFSHDQPFTYVVRGRFLPVVAAFQTLFSNAGAVPLAIASFTTADNVISFRLRGASNEINATSGATPLRRPTTIACAYDGSGSSAGMSIFADGRDVTVGRSGTVLGQTVQNAFTFTIGVLDLGGGSYQNRFLDGTTTRRVIVYPFALSASQHRAVHERFEREGES